MRNDMTNPLEQGNSTISKNQWKPLKTPLIPALRSLFQPIVNCINTFKANNKKR